VARQPGDQETGYWFVYGLFSVSLAVAAYQFGGVIPAQWQWCAIGVSIAACLSLVFRRPGNPTTNPWGWRCLLILLIWMGASLIPLPPSFIQVLSPYRWTAMLAARGAVGANPDSWLSWSVAPSATFERLLYVLPAMAGFVAAYETGSWLGRRIWWGVAPIIAIASLESVLGLAQYYVLRSEGAGSPLATGTYVNRNHFAGLLELALSPVIMWAVASWRRNSSRLGRPGGPTLWTSVLMAVAACLVMGILASLSRMGVLSMLVSLGAVGLAWFLAQSGDEAPAGGKRWVAAIALLLAVGVVFVAISPGEVVERFADTADAADLTADGRVQIWQDTLKLIAAYPWTGSGLGTYERAFFQFKTIAPLKTVDYAHNDYLQILAELGFPGLLLAAGVIGWILWSILGVVLSHRNRPTWELAVGLLGAFIALGVHSLADFNLYIPANALALAWLGGLAVSPALRGES
jgi:O-antigen ligase